MSSPTARPGAAAFRAVFQGPTLGAAWLLAAALALPTGAWAAGGRSAQLEELLPKLAERALVYERTALRFACVETVHFTKYDADENIKKQDADVFDYLLEYTEERGLQPYRAILAHNGSARDRQKTNPDYSVPEPYGWNLLFTPERQGRFKFRIVGDELLPPHFTWIIEFTPLISYVDGSDIDQWEGKVWIDQDTLDLIQVEAAPALQSETIEAKAAEYRQGFRFMGMGTKSRPRVRSLRVEFGFEREGLRFPSRAVAATKLWRDGTAPRLESSIAQAYAEYVFFGVESAEEFERLRTE